MKKKHGKRHTAEQIVRKLREADTMLAAGKTIAQLVTAGLFNLWAARIAKMALLPTSPVACVSPLPTTRNSTSSMPKIQPSVRLSLGC